MSLREIPTSSGLPPLRLPPGALAPYDRSYDYDYRSERPDIQPVEHKIRLDIMNAGMIDSPYNLLERSDFNGDDPWRHRETPLAIKYIRSTLEAQWNIDQAYYSRWEDDEFLEEAPRYVSQSIRDAANKSNPETAVLDEREKREKWYDFLLPQNVNGVFKQHTLGELLSPLFNDRYPTPEEPEGDVPETAFVGILVIDDETDRTEIMSEYGIPQELIRYESEFDAHHSGSPDLPTPSDFGIELPAPLLMLDCPGNSEYLLIPWSAGLVCQGPHKQQNPHHVICKHEAFCAFVLSKMDSIFLPVHDGIPVPARARRFVDPQIAVEHTSER